MTDSREQQLLVPISVQKVFIKQPRKCVAIPVHKNSKNNQLLNLDVFENVLNIYHLTVLSILP